MAKVIKGKYRYKDAEHKSKKQMKREQRELERKMLKKQDKQIKMQCDCNHLDSKKNKAHFKLSKDGMTRICKICGGKMIADPSLLTKDAVDSAVLYIYTVLGLVRNKLNIDEQTDKQITKALLIVVRCPELLELVKSQSLGKKKKKHNKNNKNDKKFKNFNRVNY